MGDACVARTGLSMALFILLSASARTRIVSADLFLDMNGCGLLLCGRAIAEVFLARSTQARRIGTLHVSFPHVSGILRRQLAQTQKRTDVFVDF